MKSDVAFAEVARPFPDRVSLVDTVVGAHDLIDEVVFYVSFSPFLAFTSYSSF